MAEAHYYLRGLNVEQNNGGSTFRVSGTDCCERKFYGDFNNGCFQDGMLEVMVVGIVYNSDWAWIKPRAGFFQDRDEGIPVKKADIKEIVR